MTPYPPMHAMHNSMGFSVPVIEYVYALIIVAICLTIYFRTKELYDLSHHQGIKFFRQTFLFFAIAFFTRIIPALFRFSDMHMTSWRLGFVVGFILFGYGSTMAVLSLAKSALWKRTRKGVWSDPVIYHVIAVLLPFTILFDHSGAIFLLVQGALVILTLIASYGRHHKKKRSSSLSYYTYMLLSLFWLLNSVAIFTTGPLLAIPRIFIYAVSLLLFIIILIRVSRSLKG